MTGKEALKIIKDNKGISFCEAYAEPLYAIEKELDQLEKYRKAIILLNRKFVDVGLFIECDDVGEYNFNRDSDEDRLSDFEFEFLKEVL